MLREGVVVALPGGAEDNPWLIVELANNLNAKLVRQRWHGQLVSSEVQEKLTGQLSRGRLALAGNLGFDNKMMCIETFCILSAEVVCDLDGPRGVARDLIVGATLI